MARNVRVSVLAAALVAVGLSSSGLAAYLIDVTAQSYGAGRQSGGIRVVSLDVADFGPTGRYGLSGNYVATNALFVTQSFCFGVTKGLFDTTPDNRFELMTLSAFSANVTKQNQVAAPLLNTQSLIDGASNTNDRNIAAVATGMAVWEILYEAGTTGYS